MWPQVTTRPKGQALEHPEEAGGWEVLSLLRKDRYGERKISKKLIQPLSPPLCLGCQFTECNTLIFKWGKKKRLFLFFLPIPSSFIPTRAGAGAGPFRTGW